MPKKPPPNAFFFFMTEYKEKAAKEGEKLSMKDAAEKAGSFWKQMNEIQRRKYVLKAQHAKKSRRRMACTGIAISEIENDRLQKEEFKQNMIDEIRTTISSAHKNLVDKTFYVIHINIFCYVQSKLTYYPAEIAVCKFNFKNGVIIEDVFHRFCYPGPLPLGYAFRAKQVAEDSHKILYPHSKKPNMKEIFKEMVLFLSRDQNEVELPPLYTFGDNIEVSTNIIEQMCHGYTNTIRVYCLEELFYALKEGACNLSNYTECFPAVTLASLELEKDTYYFCEEIACSYHKLSESPNCCSKSYVTRWCYIICDNCCQYLHIPLIAGQHVPINANIPSENANMRIEMLSKNTCPSIDTDNEDDKDNSSLLDTASEINFGLKNVDLNYDSDGPSEHSQTTCSSIDSISTLRRPRGCSKMFL